MDDTHRAQLIAELLEGMHAFNHRFLSKMRSDSGLPFSQMAVLHLVEEHGGTSIGELSKLLGITSSAVTQLVDELEHKGYLFRQSRLDDRRALEINLTQKCKTDLAELKIAQVERLGALFNALSDEELEQYVALNKKLTDPVKATVCPKC
jgi:DNA-binding MarR family transcriptional regulator